MNRKYDIIIYGATGFTGQLVFNYLLPHKDAENLNIAIAGRNLKKLSAVRLTHSTIDMLEVDSNNIDSVKNMCSSSKLVLTTVGPYSLYGENIVKYCAEFGTHYVDLTGEPNFVHLIKNKYEKIAEDNGSIIINCCGFESIIPDVGSFFTVNKMNSNQKYLTYYIRTKGQISGGTWASFINAISSGRPTISDKKNHLESNSKKRKIKKLFYSKQFKSWALIFPVIDKYIVKRTSKNYNIYGDNFDFNQYILVKSLFKVIMLISSISLISLFARFKFIRNWLVSLKPSGSGPSENDRKTHWFNIKIIGKGKDEEVLTTIKGGDPGYGETSKFISEMALCILLDFDQLNKKSGIITPVECSGELLIKRLKNAGITFE